MNTPLVSILMPVKNTALYLDECLRSIQAQSYTNWELIAVNDHSTDNSPRILAKYASTDSRIRVYTNKEKGIIKALRLAYSHSSGSLITRMDSDDIMPAIKLENLSKALNFHGTGHIALGLVRYFSNETLGEGYLKYAQWLNNLTSKATNFNELYKECVIPSPCWMVYRSDLEQCHAFTPNRYPEDYDLCFRFYEQGLKPISSNKILHHWRDSSERTSRHDPNYADNNFLAIKSYYFLKLNHQKNRPLVLWGAGKKGKQLAQILIKNETPFYWICNNKNKIGKNIYDVLMRDISYLSKLNKPQVIITVAQREAKKEIQTTLDKNNWKTLQDYFFFC